MISIKNTSLLIILFLIIGCSESSKQLSPEEEAFIAKQEKIAFEDINFRISESEYTALGKKQVTINTHSFDILESFYEDKLYNLILSSEGKSVSQIKGELYLIYADVSDAIKLKYGNPKVKRRYPTVLDLPSSQSYIVEHWEIGNKHIDLCVINANSKYNVWCKIRDKELSDAYWKKRKEIDEQNIKKDSNKF